MKIKLFAALFIFGAALFGLQSIGLACKSAGPNKHIGIITSVDAGGKTFTLRDAETDHLMTFAVTEKILQDLKVEDRVMVSFKEEDGKLIAVDIHS
jgi:Cu/Ag efflux protein CusF